jgi:uncharacterized repeat protein (TIGR03803 family)
MPRGGLVADSSGDLFATTTGGSTGVGSVFEAPLGGVIATVATPGTFDAADPLSGLVIDSAGNLYGASSAGGVNQMGSIFELPKGSTTFTVLASFNGVNGSNPQAGLIMDAAGNLYGTTTSGGINSEGTVFELPNGSGVITTLGNFDGINGLNPDSPLLMDAAGNLFGTALTGGGTAANGGTVYEVIAGGGVITSLAVFTGPDGIGPMGALSMDSAGNIYGATNGAGSNNGGTIYELSPTNGPASRLAFGASPVGPSGKLATASLPRIIRW